jgi:hypothetical protein
LDAGPSFSVLLPPGGSAFQLPFNQGFIPTIAGGPWTHMRADVNFRLSGGNDRMGFVGAKVLIPEPSALLLAMFAIASLSMLGRRSV